MTCTWQPVCGKRSEVGGSLPKYNIITFSFLDHSHLASLDLGSVSGNVGALKFERRALGCPVWIKFGVHTDLIVIYGITCFIAESSPAVVPERVASHMGYSMDFNIVISSFVVPGSRPSAHNGRPACPILLGNFRVEPG
jgi:hypothetical protein